MPRKIRQLKAELQFAGFLELPGRGKGSHTMWKHPTVPDLVVILAGKDGKMRRLIRGATYYARFVKRRTNASNHEWRGYYLRSVVGDRICS